GAVAGDAGTIGERLVDRLAEADCDVLGRVVRSGLQVAGGLELQAESPVAGEQLEHVIEEADPGRDPCLTAIQVDAEPDLRLLGLAADLGCAAHEVPLPLSS